MDYTTKSPAVSVVIPTRNRAALLRRALDSVLAQSFHNHEILVVDDASEDGTAEMVRGLGVAVRYLRQEACLGAATVRNRGLREARADLVAFLDDDDEWLPSKLERQVAALRPLPSYVAMVSCGFEVVSDVTGEVVRTSDGASHPRSPQAFLRSTGFMTSVPLIRRAALEEVGGFDASLEGSQDRDLWIRLSRRHQVTSVPEVLVRYHVHGQQITTNLPAKIRAKEMLLERHRGLLDANPEILAYHHERLGMLHCAAGDPARGRAAFEEGLRHAPARKPLRDHLDRCTKDPDAHRRHVLDHGFHTVDGITLFW